MAGRGLPVVTLHLRAATLPDQLRLLVWLIQCTPADASPYPDHSGDGAAINALLSALASPIDPSFSITPDKRELRGSVGDQRAERALEDAARSKQSQLLSLESVRCCICVQYILLPFVKATLRLARLISTSNNIRRDISMAKTEMLP